MVTASRINDYVFVGIFLLACYYSYKKNDPEELKRESIRARKETFDLITSTRGLRRNNTNSSEEIQK